MTIIHWFRRDFRLADNMALHAAAQSAAQNSVRIVPLFILDPALLDGPNASEPRLAFMFRALRGLDERLRAHGGGLLVRWGNPAVVLRELADELDARALYVNADYSPYARHRDAAVVEALSIPVYRFHDGVLYEPGSIRKNNGMPYVVYTPFMKRLRSLEPPLRPLPDVVAGRLHNLAGLDRAELPQTQTSIPLPPATEAAAIARLETYTAGAIYRYGTARNALVSQPFAADPPPGTSYLSPYFRFGLLSPRQAYWAALDAVPDSEQARESVEVWVNELIWREFYTHILHHFQRVAQGNFRREYDALAWRDAPDELAAWQAGQTGYPVVDAAMRQLQAVGWMPNRARMIVASFLTKDLLIDWRAGERHFMQWLLDGDLAANNGGWQWAAGTGTDAQPYFRIFNPVEQGRRYDPNGDYVRAWIPELCDVPAKVIHAPWRTENPPPGYPPPLVDHAEARQRTLAAFKAIK